MANRPSIIRGGSLLLVAFYLSAQEAIIPVPLTIPCDLVKHLMRWWSFQKAKSSSYALNILAYSWVCHGTVMSLPRPKLWKAFNQKTSKKVIGLACLPLWWLSTQVYRWAAYLSCQFSWLFSSSLMDKWRDEEIEAEQLNSQNWLHKK